MLNRWKKKYPSQGVEGLKPAYRRVDPELRALEEENERLKRIIAKQALELEVKTEMLKKILSSQGKNSHGQTVFRSCANTATNALGSIIA
jgi:hypothetical protein